MLLLIQYGGFTNNQIVRNMPTIKKFCESVPDPVQMLCDIIKRCNSRRPANMQGYIINAMKGESK